ncbi:biotin transporter BioY [Kaistia algarum]|uniref:biotin transporter BioY n=1 Tax=Kaistia algarum TaxID=2083279 RepID=UPI000CE86A28|nr:biotin transporter BioY [Kaistia algarum]MCX5516574.1 biotin transporter BioY [Kaistia algarum]PPE77512.1 biotin transporter BioY [Kaistia algarum]
MSLQSSPDKTLALAAWPTASSRVLRFGVLALVGSALLALAAKTQVPFWPVPLTMTTFAVFMIGAAYGSRLALATVLLYLAEGFAGIPVFAGPVAGPAYMMGPTAGFLWGYAVAAFLIGLAADYGWSRSTPKMALAFFAGDAVLFAMGFVWLAFFATLSSGAVGLGASAAFAKGVLPFLLGDALKIALAAFLVPAGWTLLGKLRG